MERVNNDLDSFSAGTPKEGVIKIYLDSKSESIEELKERIDKVLEGLRYLKEKKESI